ncbi:MAG: hypothetical protein WCW53_06900 [Syntrophales bacterium]|jgi:hypothetical protein|nr:hypothetical protein [Syntrophales bacterium]
MNSLTAMIADMIDEIQFAKRRANPGRFVGATFVSGDELDEERRQKYREGLLKQTGDQNLDAQRLQDTGALARQKLASDASMYGADKGEDASRDVANITGRAHLGVAGITAQGNAEVARIGLGRQKTQAQDAFDIWLKDNAMSKTPEEILAVRRKLGVLDAKQPGKGEADSFYTPDNPVLAPPGARATLGVPAPSVASETRKQFRARLDNPNYNGPGGEGYITTGGKTTFIKDNEEWNPTPRSVAAPAPLAPQTPIFTPRSPARKALADTPLTLPKTLGQEVDSVPSAGLGRLKRAGSLLGNAVGAGATWLSNNTAGRVLDFMDNREQEHTEAARKYYEGLRKKRQLMPEDVEYVNTQWPYAKIK